MLRCNFWLAYAAAAAAAAAADCDADWTAVTEGSCIIDVELTAWSSAAAAGPPA